MDINSLNSLNKNFIETFEKVSAQQSAFVNALSGISSSPLIGLTKPIDNIFTPLSKNTGMLKLIEEQQKYMASMSEPLKYAQIQCEYLKPFTNILENSSIYNAIQSNKKMIDALNPIGSTLGLASQMTKTIKNSLELLNAQSISFMGKEIPKSNFIEYVDEINNHEDLVNSVISSSSKTFESSYERNKQLDKSLEEIAVINDKQPFSKCTLNSKTLQEFKALPIKDKSEVVLNYIKSFSIVLGLIINTFLGTKKINFNLVLFSQNVVINAFNSLHDEDGIHLGIALFSKNVTYTYLDKPEDKVVSSCSIGENTSLPSESIVKE